MTFAQLIGVTRARWRTVLFTTLILLGAVVSYSLLAPKTYVSETSLVVDAGAQNMATGAAQFIPAQTTFIATQADIIASRGVALQVVGTLKLADNPALQRDFHDATGGHGSLDDWLADHLLDYIKIKQQRESNLLTIEASAANGVDAANLANAFAEAYINTGIAMKADNATKQAHWLQEQVQVQRNELRARQDKLADYQRNAGIAESANRVDIESGRLGELTGQLVLAQAAKSDAESRLSQMRQALSSGRQDDIAELSTNPVVQAIKAELNRSEAKLADVTQRYGLKHPQYLGTLSEVEKLRSRLRAELDSAQSGIQQAAETARRRELELTQAVNTQRERILSLQKQTDQRDVLAREVETAQQAYDMALQRVNQLGMESRLDQSTVAVLSRAAVPSFAASPKLVLNTVLALLLGLLLGTALALIKELRDRRVRSAIDLTELGLPVLSEVGHLKIRSRGWLSALRLPQLALSVARKGEV